MGAIASGGAYVLDDDVIDALHISHSEVVRIAERERRELARRELLYRDHRPYPELEGKTVILVDDGVATGASMLVAVSALRQKDPAKIIVAVPVASAEGCSLLGKHADEVICYNTPARFGGVGAFYDDFSQVSDEEVRALLNDASLRRCIMSAAVAVVSLHDCAVADALAHAKEPYKAILERVGNARVVLIGEASHGTHEFYHERAEITRRLIEQKGFAAVAVEADWPDALRVNRYVSGTGDDSDAADALGGFKRFPTWMWRNADVLDFVGWLRDFNESRPHRRRVGFYGLDLYSLQTSIGEVIRYLERVDPPAAERARQHYSCFNEVADPTEYGHGVALGLTESCRDEVVRTLLELRWRSETYLHLDGVVAADEYFYAEQNARVAKDAEEYYRTMLDHRVSSWNLRDRHMFETLQELGTHLARHRDTKKIVVWAHNSHVGNAAATEMSRRGEYNIGELTHHHYGTQGALIGFTTYRGTVSAASDWGAPVERKTVRPGLPGSYEELFHRVGVPRFGLMLDEPAVRAACRGPYLERAIGVVYRPETERQSHYFHSQLTGQFDIVIHIDHTRAVEPLERTAAWEKGDVPETYPTGL